MEAVPHPTELACSDDDEALESEPVRNLFCRHYDSCLSVAVRRGWCDWTCAHCELRAATPAPSATRFAQDRRKDE